MPTITPPTAAVEVMKAQQVAEFLQVSVDQVYRLPLPRVRIGEARYRYLRTEILAWLERRQTRSAA